MTESSGGEWKSGDGDQDQTTDPEMPTLTEDPLPPDGGDQRQEEVEDAGPAVPMTVNGRRYLGWSRLGGHIYERPREERENTHGYSTEDTGCIGCTVAAFPAASDDRARGSGGFGITADHGARGSGGFDITADHGARGSGGVGNERKRRGDLASR